MSVAEASRNLSIVWVREPPGVSRSNLRCLGSRLVCSQRVGRRVKLEATKTKRTVVWTEMAVGRARWGNKNCADGCAVVEL